MDESDGGAHLRVQCVVFDAGKVVGRGSLAEVRSEWGDLDTTGKGIGRRGGVRIHYLKRGQTVLPGLTDAHAHVLQQGEASTAVNLVGATSVQEVVDRIARFVEADPELQADRSRFILGLGWDQTKYADTGREFPTALLPPELPVEVPGGEIVRLPDGRPSGVFLDNAMGYISKSRIFPLFVAVV
ncbi:hypothetical protein Rhopal_006956-T1 [Rhodotorula paludigena]|uniref:Amidohydrolase 3 domain-containing protein n=1 Tax=Rhodotorula paludigena TaxID=86838 RepID=A0AAV5GX33_9BASI|nr:hypothetical protein Rhopal_006956-T1 [Rhodotorula paludigena]